MSNPGKHDFVGFGNDLRVSGNDSVTGHVIEGFLYRSEIAGFVIDNGDH
jgi:hypothetical protein